MNSAVAGPVHQGLLDSVNGLPTHPLVVHAAIGLITLAAMGGVLSLVPRWRVWMLPATAFVGVLAALSALVATETGEGLEHRVAPSDLIEQHAEAGERSRTVALVLALLLVAWWAVERALRRATDAVGSQAGAGHGAGGGGVATRTDAALETRTAPPALRRASLALGIVTAIVALMSAGFLVVTGHQGAEAVWHDTPAASSQPADADD